MKFFKILFLVGIAFGYEFSEKYGNLDESQFKNFPMLKFLKARHSHKARQLSKLDQIKLAEQLRQNAV
ncbi:Oidioi.mRNA.OKI2018_I69.chr1.g480.t1.cds [Oikopleura dioica]|uniref:Oidioi.mRNA.OKI2018_I69.chr1.g480.t1.cds n=1 Tax=Oikopleura dioica TaxID=34765 RepID=A0ABN7SJY7_OIKDI|nr:Oidioi.mRNA.OKI2018_I69.chr1.g480.t1.cds [Oikopleura dioica]